MMMIGCSQQFLRTALDGIQSYYLWVGGSVAKADELPNWGVYYITYHIMIITYYM